MTTTGAVVAKSEAHPTSITVVICAYTERRLAQVLSSLEAAQTQARGDDEVVLVVDHNDELLKVAEDSISAPIRIIENAEDKGLSGARNSGVAAAEGDIVVFVDDDAVLRGGALAALRARLADPRVVAVGGAVRPRWEGGKAPRWFPPEFGWVVGCDYRGLPADGEPIRNPIGACMAVRRDAVEAVGGFSSQLGRVGTLPVGCEETLMGIQIRRHFQSSRIVRDVRFAVDHFVPDDRQTVRYFLRRCYHEGRSKAILSRAVGPGAGLSSERSYVRRTLTAAVTRELGAALRGDLGALGRATFVVIGLGTTASGLLSAAITSRPSSATRAQTAEPVAADELISVVVCTLGRDPRLVKTVKAVLSQTHGNVDLVVVDNDPGSGRVATLLSEIDDPRLRIVPQPVRGLSAARNAGLDAAVGSLVAYTDDDAVPDPTWLEEALAVFRSDERGEVACVTGRVVAAETATREQEWFEESGVFDKGKKAVVWSLADVEPSALGAPGQKSPFFPYTAGEMGSGNNMVFRTAALRSLGAFDEALGAGSLAKGGEDLDIFRRVILDDALVVYTPEAVVRHYHRETYDELRQQMFGYGVGMSAVLTKLVLHGGRPALGVLRSLPRGVHMLLAPTSKKNVKKPADMPTALVRVELLGYLAGPWLYVRSVAESRRRRAASREPQP